MLFATGGDSVAARPRCQLVHYLVWLNAACFAAAQIVYAALLGGRALVSMRWCVAVGAGLVVHTLFKLLFDWLDGDPIGSGGTGTFHVDGTGSGDGAGSDAGPGGA